MNIIMLVHLFYFLGLSMLYFQPIRTSRFTFTLQELSIADIRLLLNISPNQIEKARGIFLKSAMKEIQWHQGYENNTLSDLTLQERLFIEASYIAVASEQGDFDIGNGTYLDFLIIEKQYKQEYQKIKLGSIKEDEDIWFIQPMTALMLETIEERVLNQENVERIDWILYAMAAQLFREKEKQPDLKQDITSYGDWLDERVKTLSQLPESAFVDLLGLYFSGLEQGCHLFKTNFDAKGVLLMPRNPTRIDKGEEVELLPARFRASSLVSFYTQNLLGKFKQDDE